MRVFGDESAAETDPSLDGDLHFSAYAAAVPQLAWIIESGHVERVLDRAAIPASGEMVRRHGRPGSSATSTA
jgi:hypothetical protein